MTETLTHFIGGKQISARRLESTNPSNTAEVIAKFPGRWRREVTRRWKPRGPLSRVVRRHAGSPRRSAGQGRSMIIERKDALGKLLASEEGKTLPEATGETVRRRPHLQIFAGEALRPSCQNLTSVRPGVEIQTFAKPLALWPDHPGTSPSPFPPGDAPALAFGNTVVLKPANPTPATAHALVFHSP